MKRRTLLFSGAMAAAGLLVPASARAKDAVRIGLLLPLTGGDSGRGRMARNAAMLAIDDLNRRSARQVVALVEDTRSQPRRFMAGLRRFVGDERVASVFGLPTGGGDDEALRFLQKFDGLLWDCGATEGGSCSKNVIHGGPTPHQSLKHLVPWMAEQVGERFVLVGGPDGLGRELVRVARETLKRIGIKPVAATSDAAEAVRLAGQGAADVLLSSLSGPAAVDLMRRHRAAGLDPRTQPIASATLGEVEVAAAGHDAVGHVAAQPYFASWISPANWHFLDRMRRRHGARIAPCAAAEALWTQIAMFGTALSHLSDTDIHPLNIRETAKGNRFAAPQGMVEIEAETLHSVLWPKIAVVEPSGRLSIVARTRQGVAPLPYWAHPNRACTDDGVRHAVAENRRSRRNSRALNSE